MKSIKQQYIDLREGNMTQANFMRNLRMTLPQYVTNLSSFEDSVRILKNKGILNESDTNSGPNAQWLRSIKDIIEDMWQNGEIKTPAEYGSAMTKLSQYPEGIVAQYGETSAADAANRLLDSVAGVADDYDPGPGEDENFERDYDMDYEELNDPFDMAESLDPTAAEEIASQAGNYIDAVDALERMGLEHDEANRIATNIYGKGVPINEAKDEKGKWTNADGKSMYDQFKEINNLNGQEVLIGLDWEMEKNPELSKAAAAKIVIKNLKKNPIYYTMTDLAGKEGAEAETMGPKADIAARQMQYLDKNMGNIVDKKRGMQPVKGVEKPKKDSDKGGETNKAEKNIQLMSLIAKTVRGLKKMDATGEKVKKITMKEAKARFMGMKADADKYKIKKDINKNIIQATNEDGVTFSKNDTASFKGKSFKITGFKEEQSKVKAIVNNEMFASGIDIDGLEKGKQEFRPGVALGQDKSKLNKESLMNMIREELKEMMDGMEPMSREDGSSYTNN